MENIPSRIKTIYFNVLSKIIIALMAARAYEGYCWFVSQDTEEGECKPLDFQEFLDGFEFWKIHLSYRIYFKLKKGTSINRSSLGVKSLIFNRI